MEPKVTIINEDGTVLVGNCTIREKLSLTPDGPITHYRIFWYEDVFDDRSGNSHVVPVKRVLFERGDFKHRDVGQREPEIIVYRMGIPEDLRNKIYDRDGRKCIKCGATTNLCIDHIFPFSQGGKTEEDNLQTLCKSCNSKKKAKIEG